MDSTQAVKDVKAEFLAGDGKSGHEAFTGLRHEHYIYLMDNIMP